MPLDFFMVYLLFIPAILEMILFFKRPAWLARMTFLPLGQRRSFGVGTRLLAASDSDHNGGYRDAAIAPHDVSSLPWPQFFETTGATGGWDERGRFAWLHQNKHFWSRRPRAIIRIDAVTDGRTVELRARWLPFPAAFLLLGVPLIALFAVTNAQSFPVVLVPLMLLALAVNGVFCWISVRRDVDQTFDLLERSLSSRAT